MLWMEFLGHGGDAAASDGLLAARAEGATALVIVYLTVGLSIVLKETAIYKRGEALLHTHRQSRKDKLELKEVGVADMALK